MTACLVPKHVSGRAHRLALQQYLGYLDLGIKGVNVAVDLHEVHVDQVKALARQRHLLLRELDQHLLVCLNDAPQLCHLRSGSCTDRREIDDACGTMHAQQLSKRRMLIKRGASASNESALQTSLADSLPDFLFAALACAGRSMHSSTLFSIRSSSSAHPKAHVAYLRQEPCKWRAAQ
jgi:hypothetical protein